MSEAPTTFDGFKPKSFVRSPTACLFCGSNRCYERVYTKRGLLYDHVACMKHQKALYEHADYILGSGILRSTSCSTGPQSRGEWSEVDEEFWAKAEAHIKTKEARP